MGAGSAEHHPGVFRGHPGHRNLFNQNLKKGETRTGMEAEKVSHQSTPVPSLNEILAQLHQDPGFRQRYKDYCRAVLDGRFNFGGIKNPIFDHIYGNAGQLNPKQKQPESGQAKTHQTF